MRHGDEAGAACKTARERGDIEVLRMRAHLLASEERDLVEMYLERGNSLCQIARLVGVTRQNIGRRIRRIARRLADDTYEICLADREDFNGRELAIMRDFFVRGLHKTRISRDHNVTLYRVKAIVHKARKYVRSAKTRSWGAAPGAGHGVHSTIQNPQSAIEGAFDDDV